MLKNYIKIAWRSLFKSQFYTMLNILGLVCGLVFVLFVAAHVWQAYQVNTTLRNVDRQYALQSEYRKAGIGLDLTTLGPLPKALKEEYPDLVANYYRIDGITCIVSNNDKVHEESAALGDSTLLEMYGFELLDGNVKTALNAPSSVVLTEKTAMKYFGKNDVVGQHLSIRNFSGEKRDFIITGVLRSTVQNAVLNLTPNMDNTIFLSLSNASYFSRDVDNWQNLWIAGFVELQEGVRPEQLELPIKRILETHVDEEVAANFIPKLKPLKTYYLDDNNRAVRKMIRTLSLIAAFILLMATINFININVSQSMTRLKEIGVRKIMGSSRRQLTIQLTVEAILVVMLSAITALLAYPLFSPIFSSIMSKDLPMLGQFPSCFFIYYTIGALILGVLSGLYPAWRFSRNNILQAVKGQLSSIGEKHLVRKSLLSLQFIVALVVLIATVVISRQANLFFGNDIGYDKNHLMTVQVPRDWTVEGLNRMETIRQELTNIPQIEKISISYDVPGTTGDTRQSVKRVGYDHSSVAQVISSDEYFADTYKIPIVAGEFFTSENNKATDFQKLVINEKTRKALGFNTAEKAIGQQITIGNSGFSGIIAGVTEDFYPTSMHSEAPPIVWTNIRSSNIYRFFTLRLQPGNMEQSITAIEKNWKVWMPNAPFEYRFMDDTIERMYTAEMQLKKAATTASSLSIIIVILGVIGLVSLTIRQRIKEVGIRKVLGASQINIIGLFLKTFSWVFLIAICVALPIVFVIMQQWLNNYHLKTNLDLTVFLIPVLALSLLVVLFVGLQSRRALQANPVNSLKDE